MSDKNWECAVHGCDVSPKTGGALYRTSPKGGPFIGMCPEHYREWIESVEREVSDE